MSNLTVQLWQLSLSHPVMPAAGPNVKDAAALRACAQGGAAALVAKTISSAPAVIPHPNMADFKTYFLNNELWSELSAEEWIERELPAARQLGLPLIISLGYHAEEIGALAQRVRPFADALELSTHYTKNDPRPMQDAIRAAKQAVDVPVLVKLSPFREIQSTALAAQEAGADGLVCVNSFGPALAIDIEHGGRLWLGGKGEGWISGPALKPIALRAVYEAARHVTIPIIGVGGITRGTDVVEYLMAGASAVQVCTAALTRGPAIYGKIAAELDAWMDAHGYHTLAEIQGLALKQTAPQMDRPPLLLPERCTGCSLCVISCPDQALFLQDKKVHLYAERCSHCGLCISRCPTGALQA
ncbi:MAG: 4Fe-4S binding protein [Longilinea sp.]|nr:4Fe-4S binding protein [Longilinea sp.]